MMYGDGLESMMYGDGLEGSGIYSRKRSGDDGGDVSGAVGAVS
ncbi:hypothetical protein [Microcystis sp. M061S2]|nr:hypothetical protein [Microcystis sp. M061S2]